MNNAHLDDEALSAVLDGVADAGEAEHVASCLDCQGRLGSFRAVAAAVAEPVPQRAPMAREQAIAAALEAGGSLRASRRQRVPLWLVGVAAALLAVGVAVPLLGGHGLTGTAKSSTAARSTAAGEPPTTRSAAGEGQAAASGTNSFATAGADLGDQSDPATLTQVLRAQGGVITGSSGSASSGSAAGGAAAASGQSGTPPAAAAAPTAPAPAAEPCLDAAPDRAGTTMAALRYRATLRWQGQPAVLFGFDPAGTGHLTAVVLSLDDCRLLVTVTT